MGTPAWIRAKASAARMAKYHAREAERRRKLEPYVEAAYRRDPPGSLKTELALLLHELREDAEMLTDWAEDAETEATMLADRQRYASMAERCRRLEASVIAFYERWGDVFQRPWL